jgi:3-hydroxyacyl-[acyl-carrier-protein] dehydratase
MTADDGESGPISLDIFEVLRRIPHRYPFLLVDRAEDYRANQSIVGIKNVTMNEPFFQGHFPSNPVMPGVLIIEAMAQSGALLMSKTLDADISARTIMFTSVEEARFRYPVRPGDVLRMHVEVTKHRGDLFKFAGKAMVGDKIAAQCQFTAMVVDTPA